jgi:hypothetical protein
MARDADVPIAAESSCGAWPSELSGYARSWPNSPTGLVMFAAID